MNMPRPNPPRVKGADLLLSWRASRKLQQQEAALLLSMSPSQLNRYERGKVIPDRLVMARIVAGTGGAVPVASWTVASRRVSP